MNIKDGFQIYEPKVFVPWGITEQQIISLFDTSLRKVTDGYFVLTCKPFEGLICELGFHFQPLKDGRFNELEFFRKSYEDQKASYEDFQNQFEKAFGRPTSTRPGTEGFPTQEWKVRGVIISHYVYDRFGPEEHMQIIKQ